MVSMKVTAEIKMTRQTMTEKEHDVIEKKTLARKGLIGRCCTTEEQMAHRANTSLSVHRLNCSASGI